MTRTRRMRNVSRRLLVLALAQTLGLAPQLAAECAQHDCAPIVDIGTGAVIGCHPSSSSCDDGLRCQALDTDDDGVLDCCKCECNSYVADESGARIYDYELARLLREELGDQAQDLQIVVDACFSSGFAEQTKNGVSALGGNWSVATAADQGRPAVLDVARSFGDGYRMHPATGNEGLRIAGSSDAEQSRLWAHGFGPYWIKKLQAEPNGSSQSLFDFAEGQAFNDDGPRFESGGTGATAEAHPNAAGSHHALVWSPITTEESPKKKLRLELIDTKLIETLAAAGYPPPGTRGSSLQGPGSSNNTLDYASDAVSAGARVPAQTGGLRDVSPQRANRGSATKATLKQMIAELGERIRANPGMEKALIYLHAHGGPEKKKTEKLTSAIPGELNQGRLMASGDQVELSIEPSFATLFFEGATVHSLRLTRIAPPAVIVSTHEESFSGNVSVSIDGIGVGSFLMSGSSGGHDYELPLTDATLHALYTAQVFDDRQTDLRFNFSGGNFRVATEWDFAASPTLTHYGIGLAGPAVADLNPFLEAVVGPDPCCDPGGNGGIGDVSP